MRYAERRTRFESRKHLDVATRVYSLEEDMDENDRRLEGLRDELKTTNRILIGMMVSIATAAAVGALNLLFGAV